DQDTACLIVEEMGHKAILANPEHLEDSIVIEYKSTLEPRSPIVTVMGHVDHGKTSLLDYIRSTRVTSKEAGGITQHIGAYQVPTKHHGMITFLDTPGHSAFTAMRARGANCTDIVVLVVAADDSVMPQTIEAIQHAKAAMVPIIVAINKIDKPNIDPDKVINDLSQHGIMPEEWGGENIFVKISAKTGEGIDVLLESIALQAEMLELKAPYIGPAQGVIIESSLDKSRGGIIATLLIQTGTLNKGDIILAGLEYGKIKALKNDNGESINQAGPSMPVEVLGLSYAPLAGDKFQVVADERKAKEVAERRQNLQKEELLSRQQAVKFSGFMDKMKKTNEIKFINIVLKADVQGSLEAIADALDKLSTDQVQVNIIGKSVGGFNESDVNLAIASKAFLLGFNVRAESPAKLLAKTQEKEFNYYSIIYDLINGVQAVIDGNTTVPVKEIIIGVAEVRDVFRSSKFGTVAGCLVKEGIIKRGNPI
ncbi:MAG: translation initiation factor IF-2, partial [Gammaproteobacteria bacterium]